MATKIVYQTLENRGNPEIIQKDGPFSCHWENTWLGDGYYFWDTFIDNAHWWGEEIRKYSNGYIICKAICDFNDEKCCDLVGNTEHLLMFQDSYEFLKSKGLVDEKTKVKRLMEYLKTDIKVFTFDAIRVYGIRSKNYISRFSFNLNFEDRNQCYMDFKPAIQICFYTKNSLNLRNYRIVFPDEYIEGYLV